MSKKKPAKSASDINLPLKRALQDFQTKQLQRNFADLYQSEKFGKVCQFFIDDIYGARDFEERNRSFEAITKYFKNAIGDKLFHGLVRLLDLYALSDKLDDEMVRWLEKLGVTTKITQEKYDEAYFLCNNYEERIEQLEMIIESFTFAHHISHNRMIGWILKTARATAHLFTNSRESIVDTLQRAYTTFAEMETIEEFNDIVYEREVLRLNRIYEFYSKAYAGRQTAS